MITDWDVYPDQQRFIGLLGYLMHRQDSERIVRLLSCVDENWFVDKDLKCLYQAFFLHAMQMDADNKRVSLSGVLTAAEQASQEQGWAQPLWTSCNELSCNETLCHKGSGANAQQRALRSDSSHRSWPSSSVVESATFLWLLLSLSVMLNRCIGLAMGSPRD